MADQRNFVCVSWNICRRKKAKMMFHMLVRIIMLGEQFGEPEGSLSALSLLIYAYEPDKEIRIYVCSHQNHAT